MTKGSTSEDVLALREIARRLDRAGIVWAVFAGAAAAAYGVTRPLTDVDILIPLANGDRVAATWNTRTGSPDPAVWCQSRGSGDPLRTGDTRR